MDLKEYQARLKDYRVKRSPAKLGGGLTPDLTPVAPTMGIGGVRVAPPLRDHATEIRELNVNFRSLREEFDKAMAKIVERLQVLEQKVGS